jgi:hypothetical protein
MGEAAGVAATLAVDRDVEVRDVDIHALQTQLAKQGGIVDRPIEQGQDGERHGQDSGLPDDELRQSIHWQAVHKTDAFG